MQGHCHSAGGGSVSGFRVIGGSGSTLRDDATDKKCLIKKPMKLRSMKFNNLLGFILELEALRP